MGSCTGPGGGFTTGRETLVAVRKSGGSKVLEEILGEGFDGVIVCDGWMAYPCFTPRIQRCWVHLLREAGPLWEALRGLYGGLCCWAVDKSSPGEGARLALEVRGFAVEMGNGMDYWFTFLTVSGVGLMDDRAERAVREFVV